MSRTAKILNKQSLEKIIQDAQVSIDLKHELTSIQPEVLRAMAEEILTLWKCFGASF